jgi:hypothetical protein
MKSNLKSAFCRTLTPIPDAIRTKEHSLPEEPPTVLLLHGPLGAVEVQLKRVAADFGGSASNIRFKGSLPALSVAFGGAGEGILSIEELPHGRCQLRVEPTAATTERFRQWLDGAIRELYALGFVISDRSTPRLAQPQAEDDAHFSPREQEDILARLDGIEATIFQQDEFDQDQAAWIRGEMHLLKEELATSRRVTWRHLARSVLLGIASMIGGQAGRLFLEHSWESLRPFLGRLFPFLLGPGSP